MLPLFWIFKNMQNMCHSSKEAETRNMVKLMDETLYQANIIEQVLFDKNTKVEVKIVTDNKPLLESKASLKQVESKMMREVIADMKEKLVENKINSNVKFKTKNWWLMFKLKKIRHA